MDGVSEGLAPPPVPPGASPKGGVRGLRAPVSLATRILGRG